jgi:hypothetical protein
MPSEPVRPEALVAEARRWLGTPFRHQGRIRGEGVDCIGLVLEPARALGLTESRLGGSLSDHVEGGRLQGHRRSAAGNPIDPIHATRGFRGMHPDLAGMAGRAARDAGPQGATWPELFTAGSLRDVLPDDHVLVRGDRVLDLGWLPQVVDHGMLACTLVLPVYCERWSPWWRRGRSPTSSCIYWSGG